MSFKIKINNEEVVSDSNLQIKEEMLSTSSTILKNCYPKSWEDDKDYTTKYYFPKDYSKCKIVDETYHPESPGTRVTGTNLHINYDNNKNWDLEELQGNTYQQTYTGKNLFNKFKSASSTNGASLTQINNGIKVSVTVAGANKYVALKLDNPDNLLGKTLTISGNIAKSGSNDALIRFYFTNGNTLVSNIANTIYQTGKSTFTVPASYPTNCNGISIVFSATASNSGSVGNYVNYTNVQLEVGSTQTSYEPYVGRTASPNPDYPQAIQNVTGRQTIDVVGKNLFNGELELGTYTASGEKYYFVGAYRNKNIIAVNPNTTYTFSINGISQKYIVYFYNSNKSFLSSLALTNGTFVTPSNCSYMNFRCYNADFTSDYTNLKVQLEKGSTASDYEEYIGQSYEINLGKNLFDKDNANLIDAYLNPTGTKISSASGVKTLYISCKPNTTYTVSKVQSDRFVVATGTSVEPNSVMTSFVANYTATNITVTSGANDKYLVVFFYRQSGDTLTPEEIMETIQIETGAIATTYSPYFTPIELNKIGDYQDRIYKENGTWYIEKKIGKVVLNGSASDGNWYANGNACQLTLTAKKYFTNDGQTFSNYFISTTYSSNELGLGITNSNNVDYLRINQGITKFGSISAFKTWLSTHNTEIYYVLETTTYEVITNEELINQLESIELLNGINNIMVSSGDLAGAIQIFYNYKEAYITEDIIFCGCVKNTGNISLNPREPHYVDLQVLDFKTLLSEGETLNYVITGKTITEAINQVVASISDYGFVVGNIEILNPDDKINAYSTLNKTAYDVFQYIADITQSKWTTRLIDENTIAIDFYDPTLMPQAEPILNTKEYMCSHKINDISFNYSTNDYRNKQIMTSDEVFANITQTETILADGYRDSFMCQNKIGVITKITVNGVEKTFATKSEVELGVSADFVYTPGEMTFNSSQTYSAGVVIVITYYPIVKGREIVLNSIESTRISNQIGRKGTISRYENRNDTLSSQELIKIGQSYIKYKGSAEITLKIVSESDLFNVGQIVNYDAPLNELKTDYMVKTKVIDMYLNANKIFYSYELSNNFNSENAINYFDNQRAKNQGNIGEGETITRNIDIENTALIKFYDTDIQEIEVGNYTSLDFSLDGVII